MTAIKKIVILTYHKRREHLSPQGAHGEAPGLVRKFTERGKDFIVVSKGKNG